MKSAIKKIFPQKSKKQKQPRSMFGDISIREEKKIWKEITRKANEDQQKIIRKAEELRREWKKNGTSAKEEMERRKFVSTESTFTKSNPIRSATNIPFKSGSDIPSYESTNNSRNTAKR